MREVIGRRGFLAAAGAVALGGVSALAGCGGDGPGAESATADGGPSSAAAASTSSASAAPSASGGGGGFATPTFVPYVGVKPTLPGLANGTAPYYDKGFTADQQPVFWTGAPPGQGGSVSVLSFMNSTPTPESSNKWWQAVNAATGVDWKINGAPVGDYAAKFQVTMAGGDIPDLVVLEPDAMPNLDPLLEAKFEDLTPYLAGDAVKAYPGLANQPSYVWEACVYNGKIQSIPIQRLALETGDIVRADLLDDASLAQPKNGTELQAMLKALTDERKNRWGAGLAWGLLQRIQEMMEVPNSWAVSADGAFTKDYEVPAFKDALAATQSAWKAGWIYPDAFAANASNQLEGLVTSGKVGYVTGVGMANFAYRMGWMKEAKGTPQWFSPTKWGGGALTTRWVSSGAPYQCAVKKASESRVKELLGCIDWMAAPWMTKEWTLHQYGLVGVDYTDGPAGPSARTTQGKGEQMAALLYVGAGPQVHFNGQYPEYAKDEYEAEKNGMDNAGKPPTLGLSSATDQKEGVSLGNTMTNVMSDIIQGRKTISDWDSAVKTWKSSGGDAIRAEYEKAWAAKNG
jgi:putative aldouronate transport system substrate-binding protein